MTYGLKVRNNSNEIVISDAQFNGEYVGLATFQPLAGDYFYNPSNGSTTFNAYTGALVNSFGRIWLNYAVAKYRITYPTNRGEPIPFILQNSRVNYGASVSYFQLISSSGGNSVWEIVLNIVSQGSNDANGVPTVMVFSQKPQQTTPTGQGIILRSSDSSLAFNSNLKHLVPTNILSYTSSTLVTINVGTNQYFAKYDINSTQSIPNCPTNPAFFYKSSISDLFLTLSTIFNNYKPTTLVGRINNGVFESCCAQNRYTSVRDNQYTMPRGNEPVIIIDADKYL